ncbi:cupredoxin domain-containing protein [Hoyosella sp. G463]|uniref:Cupredoxin domain-containing protein n=1 Tax=Lolliginicoccus lacisalsi TaxID=2742202 RepID=A0A927JA90_9ACTN|nr:cupredoxin domain-containing protein [Lolliginicoccus lacisalsi]MBD8504977.1 cupredoxin domain-containing protein [Lolliginicoccus lacisalsi]
MRTTILAPAVAAALLLTGCTAADDTTTAQATGVTTSAAGETTAPTPPPATQAPSTQAPAPQEPSASADAVEETIDIIDFRFAPGTITVPAGSTVTWVQKDDSLHTVDFTDGTESGDLTEGESYSRTFTEPGTYDYVCFYHPRMTATVIVE